MGFLLTLLLALVAARFANYAIYSWAWFHKSLGPWSAPPQRENTHKSGKKKKRTKGDASEFEPRTWLDHLPVLGWWRLRREASVHGAGYWVRPLLIELLFPIAILWYFAGYTSGSPFPSVPNAQASFATGLYWQFAAHFLLFTLMTIATFIDFDEKSIPDMVTVPGALLGILGASLGAAWLPYSVAPGIPPTPATLTESHALTPDAWLPWLNGVYGLSIGLAIVLIWGFALLERVWITRRGLGKAIQYFFAKLVRNRGHVIFVGCAVLTALLITSLSWAFQNPSRWQFVLSSLIGLGFAGGITWSVRIAGAIGMGREALGFGDVTLMAMIGCYVGWQPSLLIFFLAPLIGLLFVIIRRIITGDIETPYGPYLCMAVVVLLVYWDAMWTMWMQPRLAVIGPGLVLSALVVCVVLLGITLWIWQQIKNAIAKLLPS